MKVTVTGAASGIGKATTLQLIDSGYEVLAVDLPGSDLNFLSTTKAEVLFADVSNQKDRDLIIERSLEVVGLVNAAGRVEAKPVMDYTIEDLRVLFAINFESVWDLTSKIGRNMPKGGSIVNISSGGAKVVTNSNVGPYSATKAAILSLTRTFAFEFADREVRVNAICPGLIQTPMQSKVSEGLALNQGLDIEQVIQDRVQMVPLKRFGTASECANLIIFLLTPQSSYMTGQSINITGGWITT